MFKFNLFIDFVDTICPHPPHEFWAKVFQNCQYIVLFLFFCITFSRKTIAFWFKFYLFIDLVDEVCQNCQYIVLVFFVSRFSRKTLTFCSNSIYFTNIDYFILFLKAHSSIFLAWPPLMNTFYCIFKLEFFTLFKLGKILFFKKIQMCFINLYTFLFGKLINLKKHEFALTWTFLCWYSIFRLFWQYLKRL